MLNVRLDDRVRTISLALALVRCTHTDSACATPSLLPAPVPATEPLLETLRRYVRPQREFLAYGHALALGSAPDFSRSADQPLPLSLLAMPVLSGEEFPQAMARFWTSAALPELWREQSAIWADGMDGLALASRSLAFDATISHWFPEATVYAELLPDLTGRPGHVIAAPIGGVMHFACAPSTGDRRWDAAHLGAAILHETFRPLVAGLIEPEVALEQAQRLNLARVLNSPFGVGTSSAERGPLKHAFLAAYPDLPTRLVEVVTSALVATLIHDRFGASSGRLWLNEQTASVGAGVVEHLTATLQRFQRLDPRGSLSDFLRGGLAAVEAPLFLAVAG